MFQSNRVWRMALWAVQILLSACFAIAGAMKVGLPVHTLTAMMMTWADDVPEWLVRTIGILELAGAIGLILPTATKVLPQLTVVAAAGCAGLQLCAFIFHLVRGEAETAWPYNVGLFLPAVLILWGRTWVVPVTGRTLRILVSRAKRESTKPPVPEAAWKRWQGYVGFVLLILIAILLPFIVWGDVLEGLALATVGAAVSEWVTALLVVSLLTVDVLLPIPSSLVMTGAALVLPPALAFATCFAGLSIGGALGYGVGRTVGLPLLTRMANADARASVAEWFQQYGATTIAICRPIPVLAELSLVMAGATGVKLLPFAVACLGSNIGLAGIYVLLGTLVTDTWTFLAVVAASCTVPAVSWLLWKALRRLGHVQAQIP